MQKIVDELLNAEAEAQKIVQKSREDVQKLKAEIEAACSEKITAAREEARKIIQQEVEQARTDSTKKLEQLLEQTGSDNQHLWESRKPQIAELTADVLRSIIVPEYEKD
ncbi:MAG: hypothetical protein JW904_15720 [Spirochaetales bacterium]|nr:hypothetical protein [Spirochaetales bacterium]